MSISYPRWCLQRDADVSTVAALCVHATLEWKGAIMHPSSPQGPIRTRTMSPEVPYKPQNLQELLAAASWWFVFGFRLWISASITYSGQLKLFLPPACLLPWLCQSSPIGYQPNKPTEKETAMSGAWHPLCQDCCRNHSWWAAAMFLASPARSGAEHLSMALSALDHFYPQGSPAQSFFHPPKQSHQFSACLYFGPRVAVSWDGFLRAHKR